MLRFVICDDERVERDYLTEIVKEWATKREQLVVIASYESAESLLFAYEDDKAIDIMLLDIQMKAMDGVNLAKQIREDNAQVQIVFITGFPDFIAEGYEVGALHYLMKPIKAAKLYEVLDRALAKLVKNDLTLIVQINDTLERLLLKDIVYFEAAAHKVLIRTKKALFEVRANISDLEKSLNEDFIFCHRSYIVNLGYIQGLKKNELILINGESIPLSRRLSKEVNLAFITYHKGGEIR